MVAEELKIIISAEVAQAVRNLDRVKQTTDSTEKSTQSLVGTLGKKVAAYASVAVALRAAQRLVQTSLRDARRQVEAETQLAAAISANGNAVASTMARYQAFASEIQNVTTIGDEAVLEMLSLAEAFGMSGDAAEEMTRNAIGLAQAFGVNANTAMRMLSNATEGNTTQLQRYIPELRNAANETEAMDIINRRAAAGFEQAEAAARTAFGAIDQYQNAAGDLREQLGIVVAEGMEPFIRSMTRSIERTTDNIRLNRELAQVMRDIEMGDADTEDEAVRRLNVLLERQSRLLEDLETEELALARSREIGAERGARAFQQRIEQINTELQRLQPLIDERQEVVDTLEAEAQAIRDGDAASAEAAANEARRLEALADASERRAAVDRELIESIRRINELREAGLISEEQALRRQRDARLTYISDLQAMGVAIGNLRNVQAIKDLDAAIEAFGQTTEETTEAVYEQATAFDALGGDMDRAAAMHQRAMQRMREQQRETMLNAKQTTMEIVSSYVDMGNQIMGAAQGAFGAISNLMRQNADEQIRQLQRAQDEETRRFESQIDFAKAAGASETELAELRQRQAEREAELEDERIAKERDARRKSFVIDKALQIGQATMAGATAVVQALPNIPLASIIGGLAATQVGVIAGTPMPAFERGGSFVTSGPQAIMVGDGQSPRERVTVEPLTGPYSGGGGGDIHVHISGVVGSKEDVADWVNDAIRRGRKRGQVRA